MGYLLRSFDAAKRVSEDALAYVRSDQCTPVVYFNKVRNVGDLLNPYLVPKLSGVATRRAKSNAFVHLRAIGSVLGSANRNSYVWGAGSIDGASPRFALDPKKIRAVRGTLTRDLLHRCGYSVDGVRLGDPAILMPTYYGGEHFTARKKFRLGIVPHFSDLEIVTREMKVRDDCLIIDVAQDPEAFVDQLVSCEFVISSSLHGLILADAYAIPNAWVKFSDRLVGGNFKFDDYYSTSSDKQQNARIIGSQVAMDSTISDVPLLASVKRYMADKHDLLSAFPAEMVPS